MIIPDMLKNAPMFKRVAAPKPAGRVRNETPFGSTNNSIFCIAEAVPDLL